MYVWATHYKGWKNPNLKKNIDITFIENSPVVFESIITSETNINLCICSVKLNSIYYLFLWINMTCFQSTNLMNVVMLNKWKQ